MLDKFYKKFLKMIFLLPIDTADPAVYVLGDTIP